MTRRPRLASFFRTKEKNPDILAPASSRGGIECASTVDESLLLGHTRQRELKEKGKRLREAR